MLTLQDGDFSMKIKGSKIGFILFSLMSISVMGLIFMFSFQSAEVSSGTSLSLYDIFIDFTGFDFITHNTFRKIAHFCEFAALGFSVAGSVMFYLDRFNFLIPLIFSVIYAISDEIHQLFVPERACRIFDVFVDSCGSLFGILVLFFLTCIYKRIKRS